MGARIPWPGCWSVLTIWRPEVGSASVSWSACGWWEFWMWFPWGSYFMWLLLWKLLDCPACGRKQEKRLLKQVSSASFLERNPCLAQHSSAMEQRDLGGTLLIWSVCYCSAGTCLSFLTDETCLGPRGSGRAQRLDSGLQDQTAAGWRYWFSLLK